MKCSSSFYLKNISLLVKHATKLPKSEDLGKIRIVMLVKHLVSLPDDETAMLSCLLIRGYYTAWVRLSLIYYQLYKHSWEVCSVAQEGHWGRQAQMRMKTLASLLLLYVAVSSAFPVAPEAEDEGKTLQLVEVSVLFSAYLRETQGILRDNYNSNSQNMSGKQRCAILQKFWEKVFPISLENVWKLCGTYLPRSHLNIIDFTFGVVSKVITKLLRHEF